MTPLTLYLRTQLHRFCAWRARVWSDDAELFLRAQSSASICRNWREQAEFSEYHEHAIAKSYRWARRAGRFA